MADTKDFQARVDAVVKVIKPILERHKIGIIARPALTEDGRIAAQILYIDNSKVESPSLSEG